MAQTAPTSEQNQEFQENIERLKIAIADYFDPTKLIGFANLASLGNLVLCK